MKTIYGLPIRGIKEIDFSNGDNIIDMSDLRFPVDESEKKEAALLFIRNMGIIGNFDFSKCDYETKAWYMLAILKKLNLEVCIKSLNDTWIHILCDDYLGKDTIKYESIFNDEEMARFINDNRAYITEVRKLTFSIPLVTMDFFRKTMEKEKDCNIDLSEFDMSGYPVSQFNSLNMNAFSSILQYPEIIEFQQGGFDIELTWYENYFVEGSNDCYGLFINYFPYLSILNLVIPESEGIRERFMNELNKLLDSKIEQGEKEIIDMMKEGKDDTTI